MLASRIRFQPDGSLGGQLRSPARTQPTIPCPLEAAARAARTSARPPPAQNRYGAAGGLTVTVTLTGVTKTVSSATACST